jgi:hypothetical protein
MNTVHKFVVTCFCAAVFLVTAADAQQTQDQTQPSTQSGDQQPTQTDGTQTQAQAPIPAYRSPLAGATTDEDETSPDLNPDTHALTGVQNFSLGMPTAHSYWQPFVNISGTVDSNPAESNAHSGWGTWTSFYGGVDVHQLSANNTLDLMYTGGGMISNDSEAGNGAVQELSFSDRLLYKRWAITFMDFLSYLPESSFGFGGLGAGSLPGGGPTSGAGPVAPAQDLLTGRGQNLSNTFSTEADVYLTPRTSLTFAGGYSTLNYFDSDLLNYGSAFARAGYNYQMDRRNTIGLVYTYSEYDYSNFDQSIMSHVFQASYGRKVTGRLAFQISAGPQISLFHEPITTGTGTGGGTGTGPTGAMTQVGWSLGSNVQYSLRRTAFALAYYHGVGGGSGVFAGENQDTANGSITRQMSRKFSSGITGGFSRNRGLAVRETTTPSSQTFDYWFGGANLTYPIGRSLALSLSYELQYQDSGAAFCVEGLTTTCSTSVIRHTISFGVNWRDQRRRF